MSSDIGTSRGVSPSPSVLLSSPSSPSPAPSVEDAVEQLLVRPPTDIVVFIRAATSAAGIRDDLFVWEYIRLALQWRYGTKNAEIVVLAREGLESLIRNINAEVEAKHKVPPTRTALYGHPRGERQVLPWEKILDLDTVIPGNANVFKDRIFEELQARSQQARSTPGCRLHIIICSHGQFLVPDEPVRFGFHSLALACLSHESKLVNSRKNSRKVTLSRPSQTMGITNVELYELLSSDIANGLEVVIRTLNCFGAAFSHPDWALIAYSEADTESMSVPRSASGHHRGMWHGVIEGAVNAREHGLTSPGFSHLSDDCTSWVQPPPHDFGQIFDHDAKLAARSVASLAKVKKAFNYSHVKGEVHWSAAAFDLEASPLKYTPSLWLGSESAQFRPLVAASPSDEFSESSGSLASTSSLGLGRPPRYYSMQLANPPPTPTPSARSLAHKPSMEGSFPAKRRKVSKRKVTSMLDDVEACSVIASTRCSRLSADFASIFRSASHDSEEAMIALYSDISFKAELTSVRLTFATASRIEGAGPLQSAKRDEVDRFNLRRIDYVLRRAFMVCLLVGLVDGTAADLLAFRMTVGMRPIDSDKSRQWDDAKMNDCFWHDHWAFGDGDEEVFETLHPSSKYVQHLWKLKGYPDIKRDWFRAIAVLEKWEAAHPL